MVLRVHHPRRVQDGEHDALALGAGLRADLHVRLCLEAVLRGARACERRRDRRSRQGRGDRSGRTQMHVLGDRQRGHGLLHGRCQRRGAFEGRNVRQQRRGQVHGRYQRHELVGVSDGGRLQGIHESAVRQRPAGRGEPGLHGSSSGDPDYRQEVRRLGILGGLQRGNAPGNEGLRARLHESRRLRSEEQQDVLLPVPVRGSHELHRSRPAVPARILRNSRNAELAEDRRVRR